jgi:hypothetical protein
MSSPKTTFDARPGVVPVRPMIAMQELRFRYFWLWGGIALVGIVLYLMLTPGTGGPTQVNDKMAHFLVFAILMGWFCGVFPLRALPWVALVLAAFGMLIEMAQGQLSYRSAEFADAFADFGGIAFAWCLAPLGLGRWAQLVESLITRVGS